MKVFIDDIKKISWLYDALNPAYGGVSWGRDFLNLKKGFYFVFDYNLKESDSSIQIVNSRSLFEINDSIYRSMTGEHVGYLKEPFDTSNYLFYSILKSACDDKNKEKLTDLFLGYKAQDLANNKKNLKYSIKGVQEINSNISFSTALSNIFSINKSPIAGLTMVYDLIDKYTLNKSGKSIYGGYLTKIVRAVKNPNGGLLPELSNSEMRYLIIGEKAAKNDADLKKAKELIRSGNNPYSVYLETGWYLNRFDNKWRKKISDDSFNFNLEKLVNNGDSFYLLPEGYNTTDFDKLVNGLVSGSIDMAKAVANGYKGKIGDYITYDEGFSYYPELKDLYSVFGLNVLNNAEYSFYYSKEIPKHLVLITGKKKGETLEKLKYVALHEIQHFVQDYEGFGSGGNQTLAALVDAVGGGAVKSFFISLNEFQKRFDEVGSMIDIIEYKSLAERLDKLKFEDYQIRYQTKFIPVSAKFKQMISSFKKLIEDKEKISNNTNTISYYLLTFYSMIPETSMILENFISKNVGEAYIDFFKQSLEQNRKTVERDIRLTKLGWTPYDLYILNFQTYESLIGEIESRFTQQTTKIPPELKDYFEFYTSETVDTSKVNVVSNSVVLDEGNYEAGIETYELRGLLNKNAVATKYIIHLPERFSNSINLLHETGHILYDFIKEQILSNEEFSNNSLLAGYTSFEEYFCDSFVDYIHRKNIEPMLSKDLSDDREIKNFTDFDTFFDNMLFGQSEIDVTGLILRLDFVMKILE